MRMQIGDRVGALLSATKDAVKLLGFGVYDGEHTPPKGASPIGDMALEVIGERYTNPRMTLDNGDVVWGCQCWWGPEDRVRAAIGDRDVVNVRIVDGAVMEVSDV